MIKKLYYLHEKATPGTALGIGGDEADLEETLSVLRRGLRGEMRVDLCYPAEFFILTKKQAQIELDPCLDRASEESKERRRTLAISSVELDLTSDEWKEFKEVRALLGR